MISSIVSLVFLLVTALALQAAAPAARAAATPAPKAAAAPALPGIRRFAVGGTSYLAMDDVARRYGLAKSRNNKDYVYSSKYTRFAFTVDHRDAKLNGTGLTLLFAPAIVKNTVLISKADYDYHLEPIIRPQTLPRKKIQRIVIDAGHGGKDPGCRGGQFLEKNVNLAIARSLAVILTKRGYTVAMTRSTDVFLSLQQRVAASAKYKPDLFISLHCNAASPAIHGIEVYSATPQNAPASDAKVISSKPCNAGPFCKQSSYVAFRAQKSLVSTLKMADRGMKHKRYTVIADLGAPCILVEMGFLSNAGDRTLLNSKRYSVAVAVADAVDAFKKASAPAPAK